MMNNYVYSSHSNRNHVHDGHVSMYQRSAIFAGNIWTRFEVIKINNYSFDTFNCQINLVHNPDFQHIYEHII